MSQLSAADLRFFRDNGFLTISGFFGEADLSAAAGAYDRIWRELPPDVVVDSEATGRRVRVADLTDAERRQPFKVNDLYLRDEGLRSSVLSLRLGVILQELLQDQPVVCNTLSVEYGTQQADHLDTLFMTPRTPGKLVATWMALEDVDMDAGPLRYYPESNHIEPFRFADGGYHVRNVEMERWADYMAQAVERRGLAETRFPAKKGDLFIWDAWLLHGGSEICTPGLTRRSLITHFFAETDCRAMGASMKRAPGGWWWDRAPQAVPEPPAESTAASERDAQPIAESTPTDVRRFDPKQPRELWERFEDLDPGHH